MRGLIGVVVAVGLLAIGAGPAWADLSVGWYEDTRSGPEVGVGVDEGEAANVTIRGSDGPPQNPSVITVESHDQPITAGGTMPTPGVCDPWEVECSVPCRLESSHVARCSIYDGFSRRTRPLNPYEPYGPRFNRVWLSLSTGDDKVTVPLDNPTSFSLRAYDRGGIDTWDISNANAGIEVAGGDRVTSGPRAHVGLGIWGGPVEFNAVNGSSDGAHCYYGGEYPQKMRLDPFDTAGNCTGDILPPPGTPQVPSRDAQDDVVFLSTEAADLRRCAERNVAEPGSCTTP
jgi:hypothetical protein